MQKTTQQYITHITPKQQEILTLLYKFRFLNRTQIQSLLHHKDPKRINEWLKDLKQKEYITRIYSTDPGENLKPSIYYMGANGIKFLKTQEDCAKALIRKLYRENQRSESFINKSLFLADIYLDLRAQSDDEKSFEIFTYGDIASPNSIFYPLAELCPQLVFNKKEGSSNKYFLLEILDPNIPVYSIKKRLKNYLDFYFQNTWEDIIGEQFPVVLIMCATKAQLISTKRLAKRILDEYQSPEDFHIRFATGEDARENGITSDIWEPVN